MSAPTAIATGELVLSAWSAVSPFGVGREPFREGLRSGRSGIAALDAEAFPGPYTTAGLVPDFSAAKYLGRKGTRLMDRLTALAVTAVGGLVEQCRDDLSAAPERAGLVLGTGWASVQSIMDTTRDSVNGEKPYHVDPAKFPNTVMNKAAGQSAIWHTIKGPNTTISGDWLTGLLALSYATRLYRGGHCDLVLCGAVEEYSTQRAWLDWHSGEAGGDGAAALGEGGAFVLLESAESARRSGRGPLVRLAGTGFRSCQDGAGVRDTLETCVRGTLRRAGVSPEQVRLIAPADLPGPAGAAEDEALTVVFGADNASCRRIHCRAQLGDTTAAATVFQLAAALAEVERGAVHDTGEYALVTGIGRDGMVGCALLGGCGDPA
ncbi:beta-ketoacyl synthase N-terminal-like domain-containing protein [Kutzneria viridogrisea]|uniref:3-oxoacyl-[acyl-carrier-protein] synthase II n=1 Tax=Kutzneria viridogrisea TaxID=47990 RepID=A0ABR6B8J6_9PSEU|nr:3-oxoacyl-[acyl-carrier-protein] synthase II [Kutzneria viridogrisea]